jgi:hypothetical protein
MKSISTCDLDLAPGQGQDGAFGQLNGISREHWNSRGQWVFLEGKLTQMLDQHTSGRNQERAWKILRSVVIGLLLSCIASTAFGQDAGGGSNESPHPVFYVLGEISHPAEFPYRVGLNVVSAIAIAGGETNRASKSRETSRKSRLAGRLKRRPIHRKCQKLAICPRFGVESADSGLGRCPRAGKSGQGGTMAPRKTAAVLAQIQRLRLAMTGCRRDNYLRPVLDDDVGFAEIRMVK